MSRAPRQMLVAAVGCAVAFTALLGLAYWVPPTRWLDFSALDGFVALRTDSVGRVATHVAHICNPLPYAILIVALLAVAFFVRGPRRTAAAALLLVGANVSSQVLKPALAHHRDLSDWHSVMPISGEAFPSGHATAAMSLALAGVLVAPRAYRPAVAAVGLVFTLAVSLSVIVLNWHYPSDVVGGFLLATAWGLVALAVLRTVDERWPREGTVRKATREVIALPSPATLALGAFFTLALAASLAMARAADIVSYLHNHTSAAAVGSAIVASAVALLAGVTVLAVRRS